MKENNRTMGEEIADMDHIVTITSIIIHELSLKSLLFSST
jgi:hypothetical protein